MQFQVGKINEKGQITIPYRLLEESPLKKGDHAVVILKDGHLLIAPMNYIQLGKEIEL